MNSIVANGLYRYFNVLHNLNRDLIVLSGMSFFDSRYDSFGLLYSIIEGLFKLIPLKFDNRIHKLTLSLGDGLLDFSDEIESIVDDYGSILDSNYQTLDDLRIIRNKCEHQIHSIKPDFLDFGTCVIFNFKFHIDTDDTIKEINVSFNKLYKVVKSINILFTNIQRIVYQYADESEKMDYAYYERITRFEFAEFNRVFESNVLRIIGKAMLDF